MSDPMAYDRARHRLVFVGGLHRSGTTLLARLLAEHPDVSGFSDTGVPADEGQHLQDVYPTAKEFGGPGRFAFAAEAHITDANPLVSTENAERLLALWAPHWSLDRTVLLEKSPPNLIRARFLQALFPEAAFVMVVRHPVAVALATQKWSRTSVGSLLRHWLAAHRTFEADRPSLHRVLVVSYEGLARDPPGTLARVQELAGLSPRAPEGRVRRDGNTAYFEQWRKRRLRSTLLARRLEHDIQAFGYSLRDLDRSPSSSGGGSP
jgi:hypothetical protein